MQKKVCIDKQFQPMTQSLFSRFFAKKKELSSWERISGVTQLSFCQSRELFRFFELRGQCVTSLKKSFRLLFFFLILKRQGLRLKLKSCGLGS
jgi:hypothetical protein